MSAEPERVVLRDLRALAHPARAAVIDELYQGNVRTASELARLTGLTPSAMSYHLRALERWGIVRRSRRAGDARERPWERCAPSLTWDGELAGSSAQDAVTGLYLDRLRRDLAAFARSEAMAPQWREAGGLSRGFPWLTVAEVAEITTTVHEMVHRAAGRTEENHPAGARRVAYFWAVAPLVNQEPEPGTSSATSYDPERGGR